MDTGNRINMKPGYSAFKAMALDKYRQELHAQNSLDAALYRVVVANLCDDLHHHDLWRHELVRDYWRERAPFQPANCETT